MNTSPLTLIKETFDEWLNDRATQMSAALAYYSVFSLAPLLIIAISVAGIVFGEEAARDVLSKELSGAMGTQAAEALQEMVKSAQKADNSGWMAIVGIITLLVSASGVFGQLKESMNIVWKVESKPGRGIKGLVKDRFLSMSMVFGTGFLLLVSLILSTALTAANDFMSRALPIHPFFWQVLGFVVSFATVVLLFAMLFKFLPDAKIRWSDVWIGAGITGFLFSVGKSLLAWYLSMESTASAFGVAGALVLILLWVYYSSLILLFGAEFTQVYARSRGHKISPTKSAVLRSDFSETAFPERSSSEV